MLMASGAGLATRRWNARPLWDEGGREPREVQSGGTALHTEQLLDVERGLGGTSQPAQRHARFAAVTAKHGRLIAHLGGHHRPGDVRTGLARQPMLPAPGLTIRTTRRSGPPHDPTRPCTPDHRIAALEGLADQGGGHVCIAVDDQPGDLSQRHRRGLLVPDVDLNLPATQAGAAARRREMQYATCGIRHPDPPGRRAQAVLVWQTHGDMATPPAAGIILEGRRRH